MRKLWISCVVSTFWCCCRLRLRVRFPNNRSGVVPSTSIGQTVDGAVSAVRGITTLTSGQPMIICLADSADNQKASITIGDANNPTDVRLRVDDREAICT